MIVSLDMADLSSLNGSLMFCKFMEYAIHYGENRFQEVVLAAINTIHTEVDAH